jgi:hypothetical protein
VLFLVDHGEHQKQTLGQTLCSSSVLRKSLKIKYLCTGDGERGARYRMPV